MIVRSDVFELRRRTRLVVDLFEALVGERLDIDPTRKRTIEGIRGIIGSRVNEPTNHDVEGVGIEEWTVGCDRNGDIGVSGSSRFEQLLQHVGFAAPRNFAPGTFGVSSDDVVRPVVEVVDLKGVDDCILLGIADALPSVAEDLRSN
jgi:hypothetical protein